MKKWLKIIAAVVAFGACLGVWVVSSMNEKQRPVNYPEIMIHVEGGDAFLNKRELLNRLLHSHLFVPGTSFKSLKIGKIERAISNMEEVKKVRVYKLIGGNWKIEAELRKPIARIFLSNNHSYYIDSDGVILNRSKLHTARVLVVSGYINEPIKGINVQEIINNDSLKSIRKIDDIYRISNYVCKDPMLHSLVGQIYLEKNGDFVLIPVVGEQNIVFGAANSEEQVIEKCKRLKSFYKEGIPYEGWNKYSDIIVKYDGQIVCRKRNIE